MKSFLDRTIEYNLLRGAPWEVLEASFITLFLFPKTRKVTTVTTVEKSSYVKTAPKQERQGPLGSSTPRHSFPVFPFPQDTPFADMWLHHAH